MTLPAEERVPPSEWLPFLGFRLAAPAQTLPSVDCGPGPRAGAFLPPLISAPAGSWILSVWNPEGQPHTCWKRVEGRGSLCSHKSPSPSVCGATCCSYVCVGLLRGLLAGLIPSEEHLSAALWLMLTAGLFSVQQSRKFFAFHSALSPNTAFLTVPCSHVVPRNPQGPLASPSSCPVRERHSNRDNGAGGEVQLRELCLGHRKECRASRDWEGVCQEKPCVSVMRSQLQPKLCPPRW